MTRNQDANSEHGIPAGMHDSAAADETRETPSIRSAHPEAARIAWIVDAQPEFLDRKGKLHIFGVDGMERMATRKAATSLVWAVDWLAGLCSLMVYVGNERGAAGARVFDPIRPVNPLLLGSEASEDEAESLAHRALGEGRAVVAGRGSDGGFEGTLACASLLAAVEDAFHRPVELLVAGVARDGSLVRVVDDLVLHGRRVTVVRDAVCWTGPEPARGPLPGWAGDGDVVSLAVLRESLGIFRQRAFADIEIEEAYEQMETMARRAPKFSSLHELDAAIPWELFRTRLAATLENPVDALRLRRAPLATNDVLVTFKSILLGAIYELPDDHLEFLLLDRLSFKRFAGLGMTQQPPSARMLKIHREHWIRTGVMAELVADVDRRWRGEGYRLPGLERLMGSSSSVSGNPDDRRLEKSGSQPGPRVAPGKVGRGKKRLTRRQRKKRRKKRK